MHEPHSKLLPEIIRPSDRVLDVGGWHAPLNRADYLLDIMPYESRNREGAILKEVWPNERFTKETYLQGDICSRPWPFHDKQFDFVLCSHTLEDLRDPIGVCEELVRVARAGYIEVPSRVLESTRGVERPFYTGYYHHRWLCEYENQQLTFMFKPAMLHAYRGFYFSKPWYKKINPDYLVTGFFWKGSFEFEEKILIDRNEVQQDLIAFKEKYKPIKDLLVPKYNWLGKRI